MSQIDNTVMEYVAAAEDQAKLCRADSEAIKEEDLTRMALMVGGRIALIGGMKDRSLVEKALAANYDLKTTIDTMKTRECSRAVRGLAGGTELVKGRKVENYKTEDEVELMGHNEPVVKISVRIQTCLV